MHRWRGILLGAGWSLLAFALLPCIAYIPPIFLVRDHESYLSVHSVMEAFACAVSVLIFGIGWYAARAKRSRRMAVLSTAFLAVALLDFMHLLSYQGMPDLVTPSGPEKAIDFWLAARYAQAAGLLGFLLCSGEGRAGKRGPYGFLGVSLAYTILVYWVVLDHPDLLPRTFMAGTGLTPFKIAAEYGAMVPLVLTAATLLLRRPEQIDFPVPLLLSAVFLLLACELVVTLYVQVNDNYNFIGHLYKVAAYWLIYRAVFVQGVTQPYRDRVAAERLYRRLTEEAADAIFQMDRNGRIVMANPRAEQLTGRILDRILGANLVDFLTVAARDDLTNRLRAERGQTAMFEAAIAQPDGDALPIEISVSQLEDGGRLVIARDISQRKRSEQAIRIRDMAFASSILPIAIANLDGRVSYANRAFLDLWGYDRESEVIGLRPHDFFEDPRLAAGLLRGLLEEGRWNGEVRGRRRNGAIADVEVVSNLVRDGDGDPICLIGSFRDITDAKRIEAERRRWADAFESAAYGIAITDARSGTQITANPAYARMHGMTVAELTGMDVGKLYPPEETGVRLAAIRTSDRIGHAAFDTVRLRKDGPHFSARIWLTTVPGDGGQPLYRIATVADITEQKSIEEQLSQAQKMEAIGNLTGGIAHDFNNVLSVIIINLDTLAILANDNKPSAELISDCLTAALSGAGLTQRLLAFARRQTLAPRVVPVNGLVEGMVAILRRTLGENIVVSLELAPDLWPVFIDPAQLEASILNLAVNARDAMPQGGRLMIATSNKHVDAESVKTHPELVPGGYATVMVTDSGVGMPAEVKAHIFEPFYTTKERGHGSGLGLSMVFGFLRVRPKTLIWNCSVFSAST